MDETFTFPALPGRVRDARHWASSRVPAEVTDDVALIVSELVTNAVLHGAGDADRDGVIRLRLTAEGGRLRITVTNPGGAHVAPDPKSDPRHDEHGRGLRIVVALADSARMHTSHDYTSAWAEITIPGAPYVDEQPEHEHRPEPAAPEPCAGYGLPHLRRVETTSGPGGVRTTCAACAPPARPAEEAPPCTADTSPRSTTPRTAGPGTSATTPAASSLSSPTRSPLASRGPST